MLKSLHIEYEEFMGREHLSDEDLILLRKAEEAVASSYAPFSKFYVGAACVLDNGEIILGANQENSAFPSGLCAERVAVFSAMTRFPKSKIKAIAITSKSDDFDNSQPTAPCGACRQVMIDKEIHDNQDIRCIIEGGNGRVVIFRSIKDLVPFSFNI